MAAEKHPAYPEELERCRYTLGYVEQTLEKARIKKDGLDREVAYLLKHQDYESSQNYTDLMLNTTLQHSLALKLRNLVTARSKPYFARVDFEEQGRNDIKDGGRDDGRRGGRESLYIGKMSLLRDEDQKVIIIDWRAPIANLYYEERLGDAHYVCPDGNIEGQMTLKRQFSIDGGILNEIYDIDITTNDAFLQTYLGANADNRLKEIVSTIQVEQNRIIRADMWTPLIVQGVAGSGKTTIALHRIAYLVYVHDKTFKPENFMIIAPTRFFLNYISEILPELGVEKVRQGTYEQFATDLLRSKLRIKDSNEKMAKFACPVKTEDERRDEELLKKSSQLKSSMIFKDMIDAYIAELEAGFIPKEDFKVNGRTIMPYREINDLFLNAYKVWPIVQRLQELKKNLANRLNTQRQGIINEFQSACERNVRILKDTLDDTPEREALVIREFDLRDVSITDIEGLLKKAVNSYIAGISKISPMEHYIAFISGGCFPDKYEAVIRPVHGDKAQELLEYTRKHTLFVLKSKQVDIEDLAPLIYLKYRIHGMEDKIPVRHIVIDEAQDFSVFQLYTLTKIIKDSSFTMLGDLAQGIHSYKGIRDWGEVADQVFAEAGRESRYLTLEQSYRTTVEIMDAANKVLDKMPLPYDIIKAKPVIRHGEAVKILSMISRSETAGSISDALDRFRQEGLKSAAVICKTIEECWEYCVPLSKQHPGLYILTGKDDIYKGGTAIVPSYLAKGLEFDSVLIVNANEENYGLNELDAKLLYVAMTRALHKLYIYHTGMITPLLDM